MSTRTSGKTVFRELGLFTIGVERLNLLGDLVLEARADLQPRNFPERHLVDELALSKWRTFRVALMEKAVFEHQNTTFQPLVPRDTDGNMLMPHEDVYHLAMAHAPECHAVVLAALSRLNARYSREFCTALRLLLALRRGNPPPVAETRNSEAAASSNSPCPNSQSPSSKRPSSPRKDAPTCEPSPTTQPTM